MAWKTGTIRIKSARAIFVGVDFQEVTLGKQVVGYRAFWQGQNFENRALTRLCQELWVAASGYQSTEAPQPEEQQ